MMQQNLYTVPLYTVYFDIPNRGNPYILNFVLYQISTRFLFPPGARYREV